MGTGRYLITNIPQNISIYIQQTKETHAWNNLFFIYF